MTATFARERAYLSNARAFGRGWRSYAGLVGVLVALVAALATLPVVPMRQLLIGLVVGAIAMAAVLTASRLEDPQAGGYLGETFSIDSLRKVPNWSVVDSLPFE